MNEVIETTEVTNTNPEEVTGGVDASPVATEATVAEDAVE